MAGQNLASRNTLGMFQMMNDSISGMGNAGNQYVETFRRGTAPKADMNDSASLLRYADWARRNGYDEEATRYDRMSYDAADRERQTTEKLAVQKGRSDIADRQNQMTQLFLDPSISDGERTQELARLQQEINAIAGNTPNMDPNAYVDVSRNIDQFYTERKRAAAADRRDDARLEAQLTRLGLDENADKRAAQRHQQLLESGQLEIEGARVTSQINKITLASKVASAYVGQEGGKEAFLSREGMEEYGGLFDQVEMQYETAQAELDAARAALAENAPFNYSQEQLEEMLYLMPDPVRAAKQLRDMANGGPPSVAHQQLIKMLNNQATTNAVPESAMLKLFENWAAARLEAEKVGAAAGPYIYQDTTTFGGAFGENKADNVRAMGTLSAAMLNAYMTASNPAQGLQDAQLILTYGLNPSAESQDDTGGTEGGEPTIEDLATQLGITVN